jgi:pyrimidine operon attenuation protein/uracil phosphoribosyltransferase
VNPADQLTVMVDDVLRTGDPAALRTAADELAALRAALGFR